MAALGPSKPPGSFVIWGPDRAVLDRIALAIARSVGPELYWFDITAADGSLSPEERDVLAEVPPQPAYRVSPPEIELQHTVGNLALWAVIRRSEAETEQQSELADFLRIPDVVQRAVAARDPDVPATLVVSNADHAAHLYPGEPGTFSPYIRLLNRRGITLILTTGGTPRANAQDFEVILRLSRGPDGTAEATCEKGPSSSGFQPFKPGARTVVALLRRMLEGEGVR